MTSQARRLAGALWRIVHPAPQVRTCPACGEATARRVRVKSAMGSMQMCTTCGDVRRWQG